MNLTKTKGKIEGSDRQLKAQEYQKLIKPEMTLEEKHRIWLEINSR